MTDQPLFVTEVTVKSKIPERVLLARKSFLVSWNGCRERTVLMQTGCGRGI